MALLRFFDYFCKNQCMSNAIKIPLRSVNLKVIRDLQEKYPDAEISVELNQDKDKAPLSEQRFWDIISLLDWTKECKDEEVLAPAITELANGPVRHIYEFADILSEKLYQLDHRVYAENIGEDAYQPDQYFSVDNFLYARSCVVANGKETYEKVLKTPTDMPKDITFEALLYLANEAYKRKTGEEMKYIPAYPIETYSNKEGWK